MATGEFDAAARKALGDKAGIRRFVLSCNPANAASIGVARAAGFSCVSSLDAGKLLDQLQLGEQPVGVLVAVILVTSLAVWSQESIDLEMINRIRYEGFRNSKVMEIASGLMDCIGPRLTGSPNMKRANEWTRDQLTSFGLANAHLESWGPFGRGWANDFVSVRIRLS